MRIELKHIDWITNATIEVSPSTSIMPRYGIGNVEHVGGVIWSEDKCEKRLMSASYFHSGDYQSQIGSFLIRTVLAIPNFSRKKITWYSIDMKSYNMDKKLLIVCKPPENIANSLSGGDGFDSYEKAYTILNREDKINEILK
jgi:hypothetical protein